MIIIPKEQPVIENLNAYYIDIEKLYEHYQGEIGSGAIYFSSPVAKGAIFFDKDDVLNGFFKDKADEVHGQKAVRHIIDKAVEYRFLVSVYKIIPENIYFWCSIPEAKKIYKDLSTEFTDMEGLIAKLNSEKLTGIIDISINKGEEEGLLFLNNGEIVGGSTSWASGDSPFSPEMRKNLIQRTKEKGGIFNVSEFQNSNGVTDEQVVKSDPQKSSNIYRALEELLRSIEKIHSSMKNKKGEFRNQLKKKFIEKADKYAFLDPFAAEFEYVKGKITFTGKVTDKELARGIIECIKELAEETGVLQILTDELSEWSQENEKMLSELGIHF